MAAIMRQSLAHKRPGGPNDTGFQMSLDTWQRPRVFFGTAGKGCRAFFDATTLRISMRGHASRSVRRSVYPVMFRRRLSNFLKEINNREVASGVAMRYLLHE